MKTFGRLILAMVIVGAASFGAVAADVPALAGYRVNDHAGLLTPQQRAELENALSAIEKKTTAQVAILTVKDLQGEDIKSFALKVFETWKLGQKGKDNGLLILYTVQEDRYRLEVGYGLEGAIPDGVAGSIIRQQLRAKADPKHGTNDFAGAFKGAVDTISGILGVEYAKDPTGQSMRPKEPRSPAPQPESDSFFIVLLVALLIVSQMGKYYPGAGAAVGGLGGAGIAWGYAFGLPGLLTMIVLGLAAGFFGKYLDFLFQFSGGFTSGGSSGGDSSGGDFSGGGGSSGGGGADG